WKTGEAVRFGWDVKANRLTGYSGAPVTDAKAPLLGLDVGSAVKGELALASYAWGESNPGSALGGGGGAGKVTMNDLSLSLKAGSDSLWLMKVVSTGEHIPTVTLRVRQPGQSNAFVTWKLSDVQVTSYHTSESGPDGVALNSVKLTFARIEIQYQAQNSDGKLG